jgi:hypothetical protein
MVHKVPAIGLSARPYFHRYTDDATDLCDVLSSFAPGAKATLHELCRLMGLTLAFIEENLKDLNRTEKENKHYWHVALITDEKDFKIGVFSTQIRAHRGTDGAR